MEMDDLAEPVTKKPCIRLNSNLEHIESVDACDAGALDEKSPANISCLPDEILLKIYKFLSSSDLLQIGK